MKLFFVILISLLTLQVAVADTKITQLPSGSASTSSVTSVFPFVDTTDLITKKLLLSDLPNVPALADPNFTTAKTLNGYASNPGVISSADSILSAIGKLNGNIQSIISAAISVGSYDSQAPAANGATLTGNTIYFQSADATNPGMMSTGAQTIAGAKTFSSTILGSINGNAATSTALASNPTDCSANQYATTIDASGNLTCAQVAYAQVTGTPTLHYQTVQSNGSAQTQRSNLNFSTNFTTTDSAGSDRTTIDLAATISANLSGNATTATALAANPTDCSAGDFAIAIDAQGNLTCATPSGTGISLAAFGSSPNANAATLSGTTLNLEPADLTHPGGISLSTQTLGAGTKTVANLIDSGLTISQIVGTDASKQLVSIATTGSGSVVLATSPTITTPTIAKLANLTTNGFVKTSGGDGTLSVDTSSYASSTLTSAHLFVGNGSNVATDVAASGDVSLANTGAFTVSKVNGVSYPSSPGTNTIPVVTSANTITYETAPVPAGGTGQSSYTDGQLLIGNSSGNTLTKASLTAGANITITPGNGSITIAASGGGSSSPYEFGGGTDGDVTISSGTTTLTRDMYYNNLTISGTGALKTAGYRVFVAGTLDLTAAPAAAIQNNGVLGTDGNSSPGGTAGTGGAAVAGNTVGGAGTTGANGGGGAPVTAGANGGAAPACSTAEGSIAGGGGNAGSGGQTNSTGGTGGNNASPSNGMIFNRFATDLLYGVTMYNGGCAGAAGGGGGGDGSNSGGGGGGGGSNGGVIYIAANTLKRTGATASAIQALGGNGGAGGGHNVSNTGGGAGGGGGGGGWIYLVYNSLGDATPATNLLDVSGGTGGAGGNGGTPFAGHSGGDGGGGGGGGRIDLIYLGTMTSSSETFGGTATTKNSATTGTGGSAKAGQATKATL